MPSNWHYRPNRSRYHAYWQLQWFQAHDRFLQDQGELRLSTVGGNLSFTLLDPLYRIIFDAHAIYVWFLVLSRGHKKVPQGILDALEQIKDNDEAVRAYGIHLGTEMCKKILANGGKALHLYTLNVEKASLGILQVEYQ